MRKLKPIAILCFFTGMLFSGQTGKIAGIVTDASSGGALVGCNVLVKGTSQGASTDANGEYFIINLSPGSYDLEFSMIGYAAYTAEGVSVNIDVTTPVNASVSTEAVAMSGIVVTAEQPAIEKTLTSTKQIVSGDMMSGMAVTDVNDVERVSREIHILKIVRHPHLIQLYEIIETPRKLFLIMENCCNGELFSYITSKNRLKEEEACKLF